MDRTTICIIIKVKNDANIILEILNSTLFYAHEYIIYDYNSTDTTVDICNKFFINNNIRGQIFSYETGQSLLDLGRKYSTSEYFWVYDSNTIINGQLDIPKLTHPSYNLNVISNINNIFTVHGVQTCIFHNSIESNHKPKLITGNYYLSYRNQMTNYHSKL